MVAYHLNSKEYDERFDELLEKYPIPEDYHPEAAEPEPGQEAADGSGSMVHKPNVIMEPFAMKTILKYARNRKSVKSSAGEGGETGTRRIRRKSITRNMK